MGQFILATDSGCDLPAALCAERGIHVFQMKYAIDGIGYVDRSNPAEAPGFYNRMREGAVPITSMISNFEFFEFWNTLLERHHLPIVHVSIGSAISESYSNGVIAREKLLEIYPDAQIHIVDSTLGSLGYGMLCLEAAGMRDVGKNAQEVVAWLEKRKPNIHVYLTTDDLIYLHRGGRMKGSQALAGTLLGIKPVLCLNEGRIELWSKARGKKKALDAMLEEAAKFATDVLDPLNWSGDQEGAERRDDGTVKTPAGFRDAYWKFCENGWNGLSKSPDHGGQGLPQIVATAVEEMWHSSNMAFDLCPLLTQGAIEAIERNASQALKEKFGGEVTIVSIGPARAMETIRTALAMGAEKGVHIDDPSLNGADAYTTASALAAVIKTLPHDIIFCGQRAIDGDAGQVGSVLADLLGIPSDTFVTKLEIAGTAVKAQNAIEGATVTIETSLPCVIPAQKGLNEPRYASLPGIMKAKKKPLEVKTAADLGVDPSKVGAAGRKVVVKALRVPPERKAVRMIKADTPEAAAAELVRVLHEEARLI